MMKGHSSMPSTDDYFENHLRAAGQRAANRSGPVVPPVDEIRTEVARLKRRNRVMTGVIAALVLFLAIPVAFVAFDRTPEADVVTLADGASSPVEDSVAPSVEDPTPVAAQLDDEELTEDDQPDPTTAPVASPFGIELDDEIDIQIRSGEQDYGITVVSGDPAPARAAEAEAAADETRIVEDTTIWLDRQGEVTEASTFVDGETFLALTGPTSEVDELLTELEAFVGSAQQFFGDDFPFDPETFAEDFPFDPETFAEGFPFDPETFGEDSPLSQLLDEEQLDELFSELGSLSECLSPALESAESGGGFEIPECAFAQ